MSNITISPQMANYQNSPTLDSTDRNRTQSPTLTIIDLLNMNTSSISTKKTFNLQENVNLNSDFKEP